MHRCAEEECLSQKLRIDVVGILIFYAVVFYLFATSLLWDLTFLRCFGWGFSIHKLASVFSVGCLLLSWDVGFDFGDTYP